MTPRCQYRTRKSYFVSTSHVLGIAAVQAKIWTLWQPLFSRFLATRSVGACMAQCHRYRSFQFHPITACFAFLTSTVLTNIWKLRRGFFASVCFHVLSMLIWIRTITASHWRFILFVRLTFSGAAMYSKIFGFCECITLLAVAILAVKYCYGLG